jgi:hypothetical protein
MEPTGECLECDDYEASVKILADQIERELETQTEKIGDCAISEKELQRIWPLDESDRQRKIAQFARDYGFRLTFYKQGLGAILQKDAAHKDRAGHCG